MSPEEEVLAQSRESYRAEYLSIMSFYNVD